MRSCASELTRRDIVRALRRSAADVEAFVRLCNEAAAAHHDNLLGAVLPAGELLWKALDRNVIQTAMIHSITAARTSNDTNALLKVCYYKLFFVFLFLF